MSEQLLHQILQKLDHIEAEQSSMKTDILGLKETQELMQVQLGETNAIVRAIRDRQDETDAKLDALSMDVHKLHGELTSVKATHDDTRRFWTSWLPALLSRKRIFIS